MASNRTIKTDEVAPLRTYYTYDSRNLLSREQILAIIDQLAVERPFVAGCGREQRRIDRMCQYE